MKLIGKLKEQVEKAKTREEVKDTIEKAGMLLDDDELENVSGGFDNSWNKCCNCSWSSDDGTVCLGSFKPGFVCNYKRKNLKSKIGIDHE